MTTGAWNLEKPSQVIQIDIDPNQIGKIFQPSLGINADAKVVLRQLIDRVERDGLGRSTDPAKLDSIATSKKEWFDYHAELCSDGGSEGKINRSEEHTSELQSIMRISYAVFCLTTKKPHKTQQNIQRH